MQLFQIFFHNSLCHLFSNYPCIFFINISDVLYYCFHQHFISKVFLHKQIISNKFASWRHRCISAYSTYAYILRAFHNKFFVLQSCLHPIFPAINRSDKFPRWRHHSVYSLFSVWTHFCAFVLARNFHQSSILSA